MTQHILSLDGTKLVPVDHNVIELLSDDHDSKGSIVVRGAMGYVIVASGIYRDEAEALFMQIKSNMAWPFDCDAPLSIIDLPAAFVAIQSVRKPKPDPIAAAHLAAERHGLKEKDS